MIIRRATPRATCSILRSISTSTSSSIPSRCLHQQAYAPRIPPPTPFVPDPQTFLTLIGRNLSQHAAKIPTWEALFSLTSTQLRELGIEPPRSRRYLLRWREKFRNGQYGICGDAKTVVNGAAYLRVVEVPIASPADTTDNNDDSNNHNSSSGGGVAVRTPATATRTPGTRKMIVNVRPDEAADDKAAAAAAEATETTATTTTTTTTSTTPRQAQQQLTTVKGFKLVGARTIVGPHVQPVKGGSLARVVLKEGLWEERRGHKIDGGERRKAERRAKMRSEERKAQRS